MLSIVAAITASGSTIGASSHIQTPPGKSSAVRNPISVAALVLPTPPEPVKVTSR